MSGEHANIDERLHTFTDDARRADAIAARRRRNDRRVAASLSGTFAGTLTELAETNATVTILTRTGSNVRGQVVGLGPNLVVLATSDRSRTVLQFASIHGLREPGAGHDRTIDAITDGPDLAHILDEQAEGQGRLAFTLSSGHKVIGHISRVGIDQVVVTLDGDGESMTIPLPAIDQVVIER